MNHSDYRMTNEPQQNIKEEPRQAKMSWESWSSLSVTQC